MNQQLSKAKIIISRNKSQLKASASDHFEIHKELMKEDGYISLHLATKVEDPTKKILIKQVKKRGLDVQQLEFIKDQTTLLWRIKDKRIQKYYALAECPQFLYIFASYSSRKTLNYRLYEEISEEEVTQLLQSICNILSNLHVQGLFHGNIRPENILLNKKGEPILTDFELSNLPITKTSFMKKWQQSIFNAPEMLVGRPNGKSDTWSLGMLAYFLLNWQFPFDEQYYVNNCLKKKVFEFKIMHIGNYSKSTKILIEKALIKDFKERASLQNIFKQDSLQSLASVSTRDGSFKSISEVNEPVRKITLKSLERFEWDSTLKKCLYNLLVTYINPKLLSDYSEEFLKMDKDRDGKVTFEELKQAYETALIPFNEFEVMCTTWEVSLSNDDNFTYNEFLTATLDSRSFWTSTNVKKLFKDLDMLDLSIIDDSNIVSLLRKRGFNFDKNELKKDFREKSDKGFFTLSDLGSFINHS